MPNQSQVFFGNLPAAGDEVVTPDTMALVITRFEPVIIAETGAPGPASASGWGFGFF